MNITTTENIVWHYLYKKKNEHKESWHDPDFVWDYDKSTFPTQNYNEYLCAFTYDDWNRGDIHVCAMEYEYYTFTHKYEDFDTGELRETECMPFAWAELPSAPIKPTEVIL